MVASGALAFDGNGWPWEWPQRWLGFIKPELFTVVIKSLTRLPRKGNLRWYKPWECVRPIPGGAVNKVGLTNPGIDWWCKKIGPKVDSKKVPLIGSIFGTEAELIEMTKMLNDFDLVGLEVNPSCPNTGHSLQTTELVVASVKAVQSISIHPVIVKVSVAQNYIQIAKHLEDIAQAISLNSVPWEIAYAAPNGQLRQKSPLWSLEKRVGGGGGGVSGKPAQKLNWLAVNQLAIQVHAMSVIAPSVMDIEDVHHVHDLGARAVSFGSIHLPTYGKPWTMFSNPCKPTSIVLELEKHNPRLKLTENFDL
jgi:dihydroorotate dehydrogenase